MTTMSLAGLHFPWALQSIQLQLEMQTTSKFHLTYKVWTENARLTKLHLYPGLSGKNTKVKFKPINRVAEVDMGMLAGWMIL